MIFKIKKMLDGYKAATKRHYRLYDAIIGHRKEESKLSEEIQQFLSKG